ncbi:hypothetical protein [Gynurincola endophyticus]|uniref:hypothetical protein n=1 Tax=Gynurincola endophyticus TaxID=2479004 RepID=UPI000F8CCE93|nr:hypothetical protein [Gynurincola endophyticus]
MLSCAYDLNLSTDKNGLSLNIDTENNELNIEAAKSVGAFFRLNITQIDVINTDVLKSVKKCRAVTQKIRIPAAEQKLVETAFLETY